MPAAPVATATQSVRGGQRGRMSTGRTSCFLANSSKGHQVSWMLVYTEMTLSDTYNFKTTDNIILPIVCIFKVKKIILALTRKNSKEKRITSTIGGEPGRK